MTAVLHDHPAAELRWIDLSSSPALRLQPSRPAVRRPELRLVEGGRSARTVARYQRRRLLVAAVATFLLLAGALVTGRLVTGSSSPTSAAASGAAGVAAPATYVVRPGDTLWSIAAAVAPEVDVRVMVDRLVTLNGPAPIVIGQELELPPT
jgi:LysM repeat protein